MGRVRSSAFRPALGLGNRHVQSLLGGWPAHRPRDIQRERWELPDGDFLDVDWLPGGGTPWALVLPGLTGSLTSGYAARLLRKLSALGYRAGLLNYRGQSGLPNRLSTGYHAGFTEDLDLVARRLAASGGPGVVAGYSMGGNIVLKWLGETGENAPVLAAAAVSVPFDLAAAVENLASDAAGVYERYIVRGLRRYARRKFGHATHGPKGVPLRRLRHVRDFDEYITAPIHGFRDAEDYYARATCRPWLQQIRVPTLILNALDDPLVPEASLPETTELSAYVTLEISACGGHVGFVGGAHTIRPGSWPSPRLSAFFARSEPLPDFSQDVY